MPRSERLQHRSGRVTQKDSSRLQGWVGVASIPWSACRSENSPTPPGSPPRPFATTSRSASSTNQREQTLATVLTGPPRSSDSTFVKQAQSTGLALAEIKSILEIKDQGGQTCEHTKALLRQHLDELDERIVELEAARVELQAMYRRAGSLDPAKCTDANRCQIITDAAAG